MRQDICHSGVVFLCVWRALQHCEQMIQRYSREVSSSSSALPQSSHSNVGKAVEDCMRAVIGVLLNLTHDNGETLHVTERIYCAHQILHFECEMKRY